MDIVRRIKELTLKRNWTRYKLAQVSEVPESTLKNIFNRGCIPTIATLESICDAFGISLCEFFAEDDMFISLTPAQRELLDTWGKLTPEQRSNLLSLMKSIN